MRHVLVCSPALCVVFTSCPSPVPVPHLSCPSPVPVPHLFLSLTCSCPSPVPVPASLHLNIIPLLLCDYSLCAPSCLHHIVPFPHMLPRVSPRHPPAFSCVSLCYSLLLFELLCCNFALTLLGVLVSLFFFCFFLGLFSFFIQSSLLFLKPARLPRVLGPNLSFKKCDININ